MSTDINKEKVRACFAHADSGNLDAWRAAIAPGAAIQVNGNPEMTIDRLKP
jgi:hypothetical protein